MRFAGRVANLIFWTATAAFILAASAASAQTYPPGSGSLSASAADTTPEPGSIVEVTGTALDSGGSPHAGVEITFTITSNPGDASFGNGGQSIAAVTDSNGVARAVLNTGAVPGVIVVRVEAAGLVSQVTLSTGDAQGLPQTGGAPGTGETRLPLVAGLAIAVAAALVFGGIIAGRRLASSGR